MAGQGYFYSECCNSVTVSVRNENSLSWGNIKWFLTYIFPGCWHDDMRGWLTWGYCYSAGVPLWVSARSHSQRWSPVEILADCWLPRSSLAVLSLIISTDQHSHLPPPPFPFPHFRLPSCAEDLTHITCPEMLTVWDPVSNWTTSLILSALPIISWEPSSQLLSTSS